MSPASRPAARRPYVAAALLIPALAGVYVLDVSLPAGYVGAFLYTILVLVSMLSNHVWVIAGASLAGSGATWLAFATKPYDQSQANYDIVIFNRASAVALVLAAGIASIVIVRRGQRVRALVYELTRARAEERRHRRLVDAANEMGRIGSWSVALDNDGVVEWSREIAEIHGFQADETLTWDQVVERYMPADRARVRDAFERCATDGTPIMEQYRVESSDGSITWILCVGEAVRDDDGRIVELHGAKQDITAWKEAEVSADVQRHQFDQMTNALPFLMWMSNPIGKIEYMNKAAMDYTGLPFDQLSGDGWQQIIHPDDIESAERVWVAAVERGVDHQDEYRLRGHDGQYRWHRVRGVAEHNTAGEVVRWWGSGLDINDAVELRRQAQILAGERETILESIGDAVYTLDHEWRFTYLNHNAEELLQRRSEDLMGKAIWDEFPDTRWLEVGKRIRSVAKRRHEERLVEYSPSLQRWFDITVNPMENGTTVFFRDVTEMRSLTEQLHQAQRLESVGRLTGGIAHDFNNLLTVVLGSAEALQLSEQELSDESREMIEMISRAADRGAQLTSHLLAFARRQPLDPHAVDTSEHLRELVPLLKRTLGDGVTINAEFSDDLPHALVDSAQLESAILNLSINARDAMPNGGTLTIETSFMSLDSAYATAHGEVTPGDYVMVSVSDSGTGIDPAHLPQLFDPFFTTKSSGQGSGLGLPMVWGFVKQTGGHVSVYSEVGHGTTFRLYLPLAPDDARPSEQIEVQSSEGLTGHGTVLVAEDDALVQQFAAQQLRGLGYEVVVASSGPEALEILERLDHLDLLFTDVIMPGGMTGRDLATQVQTLRPGTPVLFASGYTENVIIHDGRLDEDVALLPKPYSSTQLARSVQQCMRAQEGAS